MGKEKYGGYIKYPGVGIIYDMDVYKCVKKHSRLIDRLNGKKMVEMTLLAQNILMGIFNTDTKKVDTNANWKFYGKNRIKL